MNCLITGASKGIGKEVALKMASLNYNLLLTYNNNFNLCKKLQESIIHKYNVKCLIEKCDLKNEDNIKKVINKFNDNLGNIDVLVNNAATYFDNLIDDKTKSEFMNVLEVNIVGTFLMCKYAKEHMNKDSIIVNMASTDGIDTYSIYNIDYSVSKAGIICLTKNLSIILPNIRVIAIAPNWVLTESTKEIDEEYLKQELARIGQKKLIKVNTVVDKIIHIIGDKKIKSGSIIRIDGDEDE